MPTTNPVFLMQRQFLIFVVLCVSIASCTTTNKSNLAFVSKSQSGSQADTNSERIEQVQSLLKEKGYSPGPVDGILGKKTERAITRFKVDNGILPIHPLMSDKLIAQLKSSESRKAAPPSTVTQSQSATQKPIESVASEGAQKVACNEGDCNSLSRAEELYNQGNEYELQGEYGKATEVLEESLSITKEACKVETWHPFCGRVSSIQWSLDYNKKQPKTKEEKIANLMSGCDKGNGGDCYYAGNNILTSIRSADPEQRLTLYKRAFEAFKKGCDLVNREEKYSTCTSEKTTASNIRLLEDPQGVEREKNEKRALVQALKNYLNKDCSNIGLLMKSDGNSSASVTAATSRFSVENGFCVADNGLAKYSIGIGGIYDRQCKTGSNGTLACDFGVYTHCKLTSQFGSLQDNELISKQTCNLLFPTNYVGSSVFTKIESTASPKYVASNVEINPCPLSKKPRECF